MTKSTSSRAPRSQSNASTSSMGNLTSAFSCFTRTSICIIRTISKNSTKLSKRLLPIIFWNFCCKSYTFLNRISKTLHTAVDMPILFASSFPKQTPQTLIRMCLVSTWRTPTTTFAIASISRTRLGKLCLHPTFCKFDSGPYRVRWTLLPSNFVAT